MVYCEFNVHGLTYFLWQLIDIVTQYTARKHVQHRVHPIFNNNKSKPYPSETGFKKYILFTISIVLNVLTYSHYVDDITLLLLQTRSPPS